MALSDDLIYDIRSDLEYYKVVERIYSGRQARLLYAGREDSAQSGIPLDKSDKMLFEYCQRLVELVAKVKPKNILLIGGGVYTLPSYLSKKHPNLAIDIVEPDKELDDIARHYFNFQPTPNIQVVHDYGLHYLKNNTKSYDLIIIDAYSGYEVPEEILSRKFAKYAAKSIKAGGLLAANVISNLAPRSTLNKMHLNYSKYLTYSEVFPAEAETTPESHLNLIYLSSNDPIRIRLVYPPLSWSDFGA